MQGKGPLTVSGGNLSPGDLSLDVRGVMTVRGNLDRRTSTPPLSDRIGTEDWRHWYRFPDRRPQSRRERLFTSTLGTLETLLRDTNRIDSVGRVRTGRRVRGWVESKK